MAAELVETTRLWARDAAGTDPAWIESLAQHLVHRSYAEPHWEKRRGEVVALERVTLYGIPLVVGRRVSYGRIDPVVSRELFIRHALVEGDWDSRHDFLARNRSLLAEVEQLEDRIRRRDIRVDDDELFAFYDERIGAEVVSGRHFDTWWKQTRRDRPDLLDFERSLLVRDDAAVVDPNDFPHEWRTDEVTLPLQYTFEPGTADDGVSVAVPLDQLNRIDADEFVRQVPGRREELVTALIRSLPKSWRRQFVPAPDHARAVLDRLAPGERDLIPALADELRRMTGVVVPAEAFDLSKVPAHLRVTFRVVDGDETVAVGKDLDELRSRLAPRLRSALSAAGARFERSGMTTWDVGDLPVTIEHDRGGRPIRGYPALVDCGDTVAVRVLEDEAAQRAAMRSGTRRLLLISLPSPLPSVLRQLDNRAKLSLAASPYPSVPALLDDCVAAAVDAGIDGHGGPAWTASGFATLRQRIGGELGDSTLAVVRTVAEVLDLAGDVREALAPLRDGPLEAAGDDMRVQLSHLVYDGFALDTGWEQLRHVPRYLRAMQRRIERLADDPVRDAAALAAIQDLEDAYDRLVDRLPAHRRDDADVRAVRWSIEELRVSLFAQTLGTAYPVSAKRVRKALDAVDV